MYFSSNSCCYIVALIVETLLLLLLFAFAVGSLQLYLVPRYTAVAAIVAAAFAAPSVSAPPATPFVAAVISPRDGLVRQEFLLVQPPQFACVPRERPGERDPSPLTLTSENFSFPDRRMEDQGIESGSGSGIILVDILVNKV